MPFQACGLILMDPKRKIRLEELFDQTEPFATFHDAFLHKINVDYEAGTLIAEFEIFVGSPEAKTEESRERSRRGVLALSGLIFWAIEAPKIEDLGSLGSLWVTSDGLIDEVNTETSERIERILDQDTYAWCLYFNNLNALGYMAAKQASFQWR